MLRNRLYANVLVSSSITLFGVSTAAFATSHHFHAIHTAAAFTSETFQAMTGVSENNSYLILEGSESSSVQSLLLVTLVAGCPQSPVYIGYAVELSYAEIYGMSGSATSIINSVTVELSASEADGVYQIVTENSWSGIVDGYAVTFDMNSSACGHANIKPLWPVNYAATFTEYFQSNKFDVLTFPECQQQFTDCQLEAIQADDDRQSHCSDLWLLLGGSAATATGGVILGPWGILGGAVLGPFGAHYGCVQLSENTYDDECKRCKRQFTRCVRDLSLSPVNVPTSFDP